MFHERAAAGFGLSISPSLRAGLEMILARAHSDDAPKLSALEKPAELLNIGTKAVIVADDDHAVCFFRSVENSVNALRREGERPLAQHVHVGSQRPQNVRLMEMIGRCDNNGVYQIRLEQLFKVSVDIGDSESLRERAGFYAVVVTDRDKPSAFDLCEHRKVRELRDCSGSDKREPQIGRRTLGIDLLVTRWRSRSVSRQSMRPTVVPG
jgi:hypothetical protein